MTRLLEIGTIALGGMLALGGGYFAATALFDNASEPVAVVAPAHPGTQRLENWTYRFAFDYPKDWSAGPRYHPTVRESVGRSDGAFCYVSVVEQPLASDSAGVPRDLKRLMGDLKPQHLQGQLLGNATVKVSEFGRSTMGSQEARRYVLSATISVPDRRGAAQNTELGIVGRVTLREHGAIFVSCTTLTGRMKDRDLRAAFDLVLDSFRFTSR